MFILRKSVKRSKDSKKKKLIIVQLAGIGDMIVGNSLLKHIRDKYIDYHISYLVKENNYSLVGNCPFTDEIVLHPANTRNLKTRWSYLSALYASSFEILISPYASRNDSLNKLISAISAKNNILYENMDTSFAKPLKIRHGNIQYFPRTMQDESELLTHKKFLEWLNGVVEVKISPAVWPADSGKTFENDSFTKNAKYIVIHPGALSPLRIWPKENYARLAEKILRKYKDIKIAFSGNAAERSLCSEIAENFSSEKVANFSGRFNLSGTACLLENSLVYIGSETSIYHLAVALNIPAVCILGGGNYGRFCPYPGSMIKMQYIACSKMECYNCAWNCCYNEALCVKSISVDSVFSELEKALTNIAAT